MSGSYFERSGKRPLGFSNWARKLYMGFDHRGTELKDTTAQIDLDLLFTCRVCYRPFAVVEDKFRSSFPVSPPQSTEWRIVRELAAITGIPAMCVAWTNDGRDRDLEPTEFVIHFWRPEAPDEVIALSSAEHLLRVLEWLRGLHADACVGRPPYPRLEVKQL